MHSVRYSFHKTFMGRTEGDVMERCPLGIRNHVAVGDDG